MNDLQQLKVITSDRKRIIVEAPAGYGKTYTMVAMIEEWLKKHKIANHSKILCVSFSVAAAKRMKEEVVKKFKDSNYYGRIEATNFHGLCRKILKKYLNLLSLVSLDVDFDSIETCATKDLDKSKFSDDDLSKLQEFDKKIKEAEIDENMIFANIDEYNKILLTKLSVTNTLNYNSIITLTLQIFKNYPQLKEAYSFYYGGICVDEFQDTNILHLTLIHQLFGKKNRVVYFGDSMQQIYRFMGSVPSVIDKELFSNEKWDYIKLTTNYRFPNNANMKRLDYCLRKQIENSKEQFASKKVKLKVLESENILKQCTMIWKTLEKIRNKDKNSTIGILFRQTRGKNSGTILEILEKLCMNNSVEVFNATFSDEDESFIEFHEIVKKVYQKKKRYIFQDIESFYDDIASCTSNLNNNASYMLLLKAFMKKIIQDKLDFVSRDKSIMECLDSYLLKQSIADIESKVVLSTIHGAKGLEWDYIILANFQDGEFPNYYDIKEMGKVSIEKSVSVENIDKFKEILNTFYVAVTRAKKDIYVSYSKKSYSGWNEYLKNTSISFLSKLPFFECEIIRK